MEAGTTYIDTRISNDFNPNILPPGGWHTAEVCGEPQTKEQPSERIWNTVFVKDPPGSQAHQPKPQQQRVLTTPTEPTIPAHRNSLDRFSFDKVNNWTISQVDDTKNGSMRRSFPQKAIVGPSAVQTAPSPVSSAPFPPSSPSLNDRKVRFSLTDEVIQELSASYESIPFDPDEKRPPALGGLQAVSFNAEKLKGWTIMNLQQVPLPSEMQQKEKQIPGEMFITYVEDGMLKVVFLQKQTDFLKEEEERDLIRSDEFKKQNGVHSDIDSGKQKGQRRFSVSSKFSDDTRRESQEGDVSVNPKKGLLNHRDSFFLKQTPDTRRESQNSSVSNGMPDGVLNQKESVSRQVSHISLAGSLPDWSWEPNGGQQTTGETNSTTAEVERQEENPPVATQVVVNGQHYYVTKEDNAAAPESTLRKVDSPPPSTIQCVSDLDQLSGPPNRPPPSYDVLETVPKLPLDDNTSVSSLRTTSSTSSSIRAAISATEDVLVKVTKGEGKSLHVNVRPPEGMSPGDIEVDLDLTVLDDEGERGPTKKEERGPIEKEEREPIEKEKRGPTEKEENGPIENEGRGPIDTEERGPTEREEEGGPIEDVGRGLITELLGVEEPKMDDKREEEDTNVEGQTKETTPGVEDGGSVKSTNSSGSRKNKEKKNKMRWSNLGFPQKQQKAVKDNLSSEDTIIETIETSNGSQKGSVKTNKLQGGLAKLSKKFKK